VIQVQDDGIGFPNHSAGKSLDWNSASSGDPKICAVNSVLGRMPTDGGQPQRCGFPRGAGTSNENRDPADDEAVIRIGLRAMLEDAGHQVVATATNGTRGGRTRPRPRNLIWSFSTSKCQS